MSDLDKKYYNYRKDIRRLYKNDTIHNGDLCSNILQIRDKNKCVSSIKIGIQDYLVDLEFEDETPDDKKIKVMNKVAVEIGKYIDDNKAVIDKQDDDDFSKFIKADTHLFCDIAMIGNALKFNL